MPTARPIMPARVGVVEPIGCHADAANTPSRPTASPSKAPIMLAPAAIREPKVTIRMTNAITAPMPSAALCSGVWSPIEPPTSALSPASRAWPATPRTWS